MKDLGEATYILEIKITRDRSKRLIALSQIAYLEKIQKNFLMENSKKGYTLMIEKPDYRKSQGAKLLVRYNDHGTTVKAILKYLRNTKDMILVYGAKPEAKLKVSCYADASFQTDKNDNKPKRDMCRKANLLEDKQIPSVGVFDEEAEYAGLKKAEYAGLNQAKYDRLIPSEICCMENPEQAFVEYASSRTDEVGEGLVSEFMESQDARLSKFEADFKRQQGEMTNKTDIVLKAITDQIVGKLHSDTVRKLNLMLESLGLVPQSSNTKFICSKEDDGEVMFIKIIRDDDEPQNEDPNKGEGATMEETIVEYFDTFPTRNELTYHGKLNPREDANEGIINFTGRIKGMHVFIGNFTYVVDFMIVEDISSIIDPRTDEVAYKMPHKIEQYDSLLDLEKEHTKSVYLRYEEDKRRGVEYVMSKILAFYKECLELGPEYLTGMDDEGEVT
ncbi:hypothetical protein Tco_0890814 [Tanacetum coccineum]|uniref:Uncharacterized protein n=1 Tax=Tanacetum coccineum TaxID=301880 RepID=A0ABQ5C4G1_9ASTR